MIEVIVAFDESNGIGKGGLLPWHLPEDLNHFRNITIYGTKTDKVLSGDPIMMNNVIMGSATWESLPPNVRPLPLRINHVVTSRDHSLFEGASVHKSLKGAIKEAERVGGNIIIIGGSSIYSQILEMDHIPIRLHVTRILGEFNCDKFFPDCLTESDRVYQSKVHRSANSGLEYQFEIYEL